MAHLKDTLAEFVFEELGGEEMETARRHVAQCLECQARVAGFQKIQRSLQELPDVDVPRRMVFLPSATAFQDNRSRWLSLAWGVPSALVVALVLAVLVGGPLRFERNDSGFVFGLGSSDGLREPLRTDALSSPVSASLLTAPLDYESLDYGQIVDRIREQEQDWLRSEIERLLAAAGSRNEGEIQRVRGELEYLAGLLRLAQRDAYENATHIQVLAQRTGE